MATSSFGKMFRVGHEKEEEFVEEMRSVGNQTLKEDFQSYFVYLSQNKSLKESIDKVLLKGN